MSFNTLPIDLQSPAARIKGMADLFSQEQVDSRAEEQEMIASISKEAAEVLSYLEKVMKEVEKLIGDYGIK